MGPLGTLSFHDLATPTEDVRELCAICEIAELLLPAGSLMCEACYESLASAQVASAFHAMHSTF